MSFFKNLFGTKYQGNFGVINLAEDKITAIMAGDPPSISDLKEIEDPVENVINELYDYANGADQFITSKKDELKKIIADCESYAVIVDTKVNQINIDIENAKMVAYESRRRAKLMDEAYIGVTNLVLTPNAPDDAKVEILNSEQAVTGSETSTTDTAEVKVEDKATLTGDV